MFLIFKNVQKSKYEYAKIKWETLTEDASAMIFYYIEKTAYSLSGVV